MATTHAECWVCCKLPRPTGEGAQVLALCEDHLRIEIRKAMGLPVYGDAA